MTETAPARFEGEADDLMLMEELDNTEEGPGIWFLVALAIGAISLIVILGALIFLLIGTAQTPSPLLR